MKNELLDWYPSQDQIKFAFKKIGTQDQISKKLKLSSGGSRTVRSWVLGERKMTFATWRMICEMASLKIPSID